MIKSKKSLKRFLAAGLAAAVIGTGINVVTIQPVQAKVAFDIFDFEAHRGGRAARPENTLISFAYALEMGVTTLEMDMQMTKDGRIVISHNPTMNPYLAKGPDGQYVKADQYDIRTMTLDEVKKFDVGTMNPNAGSYFKNHGVTQISVPGTRIPTLEEVFDLVKSYGNDKVFFNIETKSYADPKDPNYKNNPDPAKFVKAFNDIVKKYNMEDRVVLQSFDWRTLVEMKKLNPNISLAALSSEQPSWGPSGLYLRVNEKEASPWLGGLNIHDFNGNYVKAAKAIGADIVSPYFEELTPSLVAEAHSLGMKVVPWTVNSPKDINNLLDMDVDGIITDKPWILKQILTERGMEMRQPTVNVNSPYHTGTGINDVKPVTTKKGEDASH